MLPHVLDLRPQAVRPDRVRDAPAAELEEDLLRRCEEDILETGYRGVQEVAFFEIVLWVGIFCVGGRGVQNLHNIFVSKI